MPAAPLPHTLEEKLDGLAAAVRRMSIIRGCGWLILAALGGAAVAIALDAALDLPGWVRGLMLLGWAALTMLVCWRMVVRPWRDPIPAAELAARVEQYFPGLSERLTTLVELHEHAGPGNGSRALIGVLARETDQRTRRLDFSRVAPTGPAVTATVLAVAAAAAFVGQLAFAGFAGERVRRFALPWYTPTAVAPYRVVVSSGDPVIKRGAPVTLSAYLEPTRPNASLPDTAALVVRAPGSREERKLPMTGGEGAAFHLTRPGVADDFEYCVEAGPARSNWHAVLVADPVALAAGTTVTLHPPRYAEGVVAPQVRDEFAEFEALQYSRAELALRFSRPAAEAYLDWRPADPTRGERSRVPVRLADDRTAGSAELPVISDGTLTLVLIGDRGIREDLPAAVRTSPDAPPRFEKVVGLTGSARDVRPDEHIPLELAVVDDLLIESVRVEYCLNGNESDIRSVPVPIPGVGTNRAEGAFAFALAGKAQEGDTLLFRVRVSDNRSVPDRKLGPQHAVYPPTGWAELHVTASARPLVEQEVMAQRDRVRDRLKEATRLVGEAAADVRAVQDASTDGPLTADQAYRLRRSREAISEAGQRLGELADEAGLTPDLRSLADAVRSVADGPLRQADAAVKASGADPTRPERDKSLGTATERLNEVLARLAELASRNEATAQTRLDRLGLSQLADDQRALAEQAANPDATADELAKRQKDLLARLNEVVAGSELLKGAMDAATEERVRELAFQAKRLAADQTALDQAARETERTARLNRTQDLARQQRELAEEASRLAGRTDTPVRLAGTAPPEQQPFESAVEQLARGDTERALTEQEKAARELERVAESLARAAAARGDRREAARQIARWQDDLRRRYADAVGQAANGRLRDDIRERFAGEQSAIREAAELLRETDADTELARAAATARSAVRAAAESVADSATDAQPALKRAADALAELADRMPSAAQRAKDARARLDRLLKDQEAIARDAHEAVRGAARDALGQKLDAAAARQDALAKRVRQLDAPGHEARRDVAATAAEQAAADLRSGILPDIPLSQQEVRRQLDRLRQALDGAPPPDELADELARLQRDVAEAAAALPPRPTAEQLNQLQNLQREVSRRLAGLPAPEAAGQLADAKDAVRATEDEIRKGDRPDELRKKAQAAADTLGRLANQLAGVESDQERVARLAREREAEVVRAKQFERQQANPEAAAEARRQVQRQIEELDQTRAGKAQAARQKAAEALQRLRQSADPARDIARQQDAADALRRLADEMARNGDRSSATRPVGPPEPTDADELRRLTGNGNLPSDRDAADARELARRQRELRDATSEAAAELARGVRPAGEDALGPLAEDQGQIADAVRDLERRLDPEKLPAESGLGKQAGASTRRAADQLRAGSVNGGLRAGADAEADLSELARSDLPADAAKDARDLATRQAALNERLRKLAGNPAVESARQHQRQGELITEADRLAESMRGADVTPDSPLGRAASAAGQARERMEQAMRDTAAGRPERAADARRQAGAMLERASSDAAAAAGSPTGSAAADTDAREAGAAVRQAGDHMRRADTQLGRPGRTSASSEAMKQAAEALSRAAGALGRTLGGGQPDGRASRSGAPQSGGNDGSSTAPQTEVVPAEIAEYLTRPWGELPGDVRSQIIQELAARYGEDYARTIKLYFESLAERK
jgi:hypothetical protein